jgi:hypothetical protein
MIPPSMGVSATSSLNTGCANAELFRTNGIKSTNRI